MLLVSGPQINLLGLASQPHFQAQIATTDLFKKAKTDSKPLDQSKDSLPQLRKRLKNKTMREILQVATQEGITIKLKGSGRLKRLSRVQGQSDQFLAELR